MSGCDAIGTLIFGEAAIVGPAAPSALTLQTPTSPHFSDTITVQVEGRLSAEEVLHSEMV